MTISDIIECTSSILKGLEGIINTISQSRHFENPMLMGTFPNFEEMGMIQKAIDNPAIYEPAERILSKFPKSLIDSGTPEQLRANFLQCIVMAASYPDLFKRSLNAESIAHVIYEAIDGYVSVLTVTLVSGIIPMESFDLDGCNIIPAHSFNNTFWFSNQVPWGTIFPSGHSEAIIFKQNRLQIDSITGEYINNEVPTANVVQALRIASDSEVYSMGSIQKGLVFNPINKFMGGTIFSSGYRRWEQKQFNFREKSVAFDIANIEEANYIISVLNDDKTPLKVAIHRYNMAIERNNPKDRLVDLAIAAESLFLGKDEKEILTYRMSMRAARLLAPPETRQETFDWIKEIYDLRSAIVHGDRKPSKGKVKNIAENEVLLREEVYKFAEFVRNSIRWFARLTELGYTNFPKFCDQLLLSVTESENVMKSLSVPNLPKNRIREIDLIINQNA